MVANTSINMPSLELTAFILDVDGVLSDGTFLYDDRGKRFKRFGPDDADALNAIADNIEIRFISGDTRGESISRARIERDMGFSFEVVSSNDRVSWLDENFGLDKVAFMADGFLDAPALMWSKVGICPANASELAVSCADFVTKAKGGQRAVAEACMFLDQVMGWETKAFSKPS